VPPRVEYSLTEIGMTFRPVLESIEVWGEKYIQYLHQQNSQGSAG
jgi:DNA-binding HxlR family transcriptional regulator